jgi:outer membrane protein with beta-barrel domain
MRKLGLLCGALLLVASAAAAQEHASTEVVAGYSYLRANPNTSSADSFNLNGGTASVAFYPWHWLGFAADFAGNHVSQIGSTNVDNNLFTYLFGPRVRLPGTKHFKPFAQTLVGAAHATGATAFAGAGTHNSLALAVGGGLDIPMTRHWGLRAFEVDYLPTWFPESATGGRVVQNNIRVSTGVRFRF